MSKNEPLEARMAVLKAMFRAKREMPAKTIAEQAGISMDETWAVLRHLEWLGVVSSREYANGYTVYQVVRK